jgi:hypothetical protein
LNLRAFLGVFRFAKMPVRRPRAVSPRGEGAIYPGKQGKEFCGAVQGQSPGDRFSGLRHCRDRLHSAVFNGLRSTRNDDELR